MQTPENDWASALNSLRTANLETFQAMQKYLDYKLSETDDFLTQLRVLTNLLHRSGNYGEQQLTQDMTTEIAHRLNLLITAEWRRQTIFKVKG